jgi:sugar phosphate isomerase/epimerase
MARPQPLLSFSTLGCPDWTFSRILEFAANNHYDGIEFRGIQRQLDLPQCPEFNSAKAIATSKKMVVDKGLKIVNLGASTELHHSDPATRQKHLDQGKRFIDLATQLNCPYIRVFPNNLPNTEERNKVIDRIIEGLTELGAYAKKANVTVLMESHGDAVKTDELRKIMQATVNANTGLVWDIVNMWSVTKEPPAQVYAQLKKYIRHTHLKDVTFKDDQLRYVLFGTGKAPVFEAIDALYKDGYKGYYSFEWEKLWHPEIEDPELALADFPVKMRKHFEVL